MTFHTPAIVPAVGFDDHADPRAAASPSVRIIPDTAGQSSFCYDTFSPKVAREARASADRIRQCMEQSVIDIGRELLRMKDTIPHGDFLPWVGAELRMTPRSAQNYMSVVTAFADESELVSYLPPSTLFALSRKSTLPGARIDLLKRIAAGGRPGEGEVADILRCHKPPKKPVQDDPEPQELAADAMPPTAVAADLEREADRLASELVYMIGEAAVDLSKFLLAGGGVQLGKSLDWTLATAAKREEQADDESTVDRPVSAAPAMIEHLDGSEAEDAPTDRSPPGFH